MVTVVTEGIFSYCGFKVKIDTDRYLGPERAAVRVHGRGDRPRHDGRVRLADAVARRRAPPDRRLPRRRAWSPATLMLALANGDAVEMTVDGGREARGAGRANRRSSTARARSACACGCGSATIGMFAAAMARPCRRGGRRRRPHHGRAAASIRPDAPRHAAARAFGVRGPQVDARPLFPGRSVRAPGWGGTDVADPLAIVEKIDPKIGVARIAAADGLDDGRAFGVVRARRSAQARAAPGCRR
jgi:hypothetical protein